MSQFALLASIALHVCKMQTESVYPAVTSHLTLCSQALAFHMILIIVHGHAMKVFFEKEPCAVHAMYPCAMLVSIGPHVFHLVTACVYHVHSSQLIHITQLLVFLFSWMRVCGHVTRDSFSLTSFAWPVQRRCAPKVNIVVHVKVNRMDLAFPAQICRHGASTPQLGSRIIKIIVFGFVELDIINQTLNVTHATCQAVGVGSTARHV